MSYIVLKPTAPPKTFAPNGTYEITMFNGKKFFIKAKERVTIDLSDEEEIQQANLISAGLPTYSIRLVGSDGGL